MKKIVHVAVIGCGRISGHHCRSIVEAPGVKLAAVCDLDEKKAQAYAKEFSVPCFTNYREMLRRIPEVDVVAVITPSGMHYEHSLEILDTYRKHVIVEKPTFMRPSQARRVFALARRLGLQVFPVFQNRHNLAVQRVLRGLQSGELGKPRIISVRVRWCRPQRYYEMAPWRGTFAQDGGALTNQGIHHIDLLRLFGGEVRRVNCLMRTLGVDIEVEDTALATVQFKNDVVGAVEVTTAARPSDFEASLSLVCENGLAQIGGIAVNELQIFTPDPSACVAHSEDFSGCIYGNGHKQIYREISAFFNEGVPFSVAESDSTSTLQLLNAFYRSDEAREWVEVDSEGESTRLGREDESLASLYRSQPEVVRA